MHVCRVGVDFHEDFLMKMFMATLENNTISWSEGLPAASLCSLKDFYAEFFKNYKQNYSSIVLK